MVICKTDTRTLTLAWLTVAPLLINLKSRPGGVGVWGGTERVKLSGYNIILGDVILSNG